MLQILACLWLAVAATMPGADATAERNSGRSLLQAPAPAPGDTGSMPPPQQQDQAQSPPQEQPQPQQPQPQQPQPQQPQQDTGQVAEGTPTPPGQAPPGVITDFQEDQLNRGPCAASDISGFVCQKAHVNGTLRIHWTPFKNGDMSSTMGLELIGKTTGWVGLAWTQFPGNMVGSDAIIITDSAPGGMGLFKLQAKAVSGVVLQTGDKPGFQVNNLTMVRDNVNFRTFGTFTRQFDRVWKGEDVYRMIGAAGTTNELAYHGVTKKAFKFSLSQPGPVMVQPAQLPPGLTAPPGSTIGDEPERLNLMPVPNPSVGGAPPAPGPSGGAAPPPAPGAPPPPSGGGSMDRSAPPASPASPTSPASPASPGVTAAPPGGEPSASGGTGGAESATAPDSSTRALEGTVASVVAACLVFGVALAA